MLRPRRQPVPLAGVLLATLVVACSQDAVPATHAQGGMAGAGAPATSAGAAGSASGGVGGSVGGGGTGGAPTTGGNGAAGSAGTGGAAGAGAGGGPELAAWHLYGRWDLTTAGRAVTVNSGSHVTATFNGTGISAEFDTSTNTGDTPTVSFRIDDGELLEKEIAPSLELASALTPGEHTVTLFARGMSEFSERWTPPLVASTVFLGLSVTGGSIVPSPRAERLKMEFLGDSITEGVALHDQGPDGQTSANWRTDGPRAYATLTAVELGAEWRQVGFGRQGLTIVGNGGVPKAQDAFNWIYAGVPRDSWQADVVVINQGTNDSGANGETFAPLYLGFLELVRAAYPDAKIVALRPFSGPFGNEIAAQVQARHDAGDAAVYYVDTAGWTSPEDFTDGLHPNVSGSLKIRDHLVDALVPLLN